MAEPLKMSFGLWTRMGPRKDVFHGGCTLNTTEPSVCGDDAAFLSNYFDHLFIIVIINLCAAGGGKMRHRNSMASLSRHFESQSNAERVSCAKMAEPLKMSFGLWTRMGPRKDVLHGGAH